MFSLDCNFVYSLLSSSLFLSIEVYSSKGEQELSLPFCVSSGSLFTVKLVFEIYIFLVSKLKSNNLDLIVILSDHDGIFYRLNLESDEWFFYCFLEDALTDSIHF